MFIRNWSVVPIPGDFCLGLYWPHKNFLEGYEKLVLIIIYVFGRITNGTIRGWIFVCRSFVITNSDYIMNHEPC